MKRSEFVENIPDGWVSVAHNVEFNRQNLPNAFLAAEQKWSASGV